MGDFLIRDNFIDCSRKIEEPIERLAFYDCIFEYGDTGSDILESCPISEDG